MSSLRIRKIRSDRDSVSGMAKSLSKKTQTKLSTPAPKQAPKTRSPPAQAPCHIADDDESVADAFFQPGEVIDDRFRVVKLLKEGGYGQVYEAKDIPNGEAPVALKLESRACPSPLMEVEATVLQRMQGTRHAPVLCAAGRVGDAYSYIAMQLLGQNLSRLRRMCPQQAKRFSLPTIVRLAVQCVAAIKDLHSVGYVHRDVKGSNFAIGGNPLNMRTVFLLDFGLVRLHLDPAGNPVPERERTGFRGTVRYASIAVHEKKDAGRKDDMWSLLYTIVEWFTGRLPWAVNFNRSAVHQAKINTSVEMLCHGLPEEMMTLAHHIKNLRYPDKPNYSLVDDLIRQMATRHGIAFEGPFDWEDNWNAL